ncbi:MAG: hypothetical protein AAFV33_24225 [Chloroflexota bacterium]
MSRIDTSHFGTEEKHPDAQDYILRLVVECRRQMAEGKQPRVSYSQINEWYAHQRELAACGTLAMLFGSDFVTVRRGVESDHEDLVRKCGELITTMKLLQADYTGYTVTEDDLNQIERMALQLTECRKSLFS